MLCWHLVKNHPLPDGNWDLVAASPQQIDHELQVIEALGFPGYFLIVWDIVRFAADKGWPIVAAFNRAGAKVGRDIGRLAGLGRDP